MVMHAGLSGVLIFFHHEYEFGRIYASVTRKGLNNHVADVTSANEYLIGGTVCSFFEFPTCQTQTSKHIQFPTNFLQIR